MSSPTTTPPSPPPKVHIKITLTPPTHSFTTCSLTPLLTFTITSTAPHPITLFTFNHPLSLPSALTNRTITIHALPSRQKVETCSLRVNRPAITRIRGDADEAFYLTLYPDTPVELSTPFGRGGGVNKVRPVPKAVAEKGWEVDDEGRERKVRRSVQPTGVDGLEPGVEYEVGLDRESLEGMWWAGVEKGEVLVEERTGKGRYMQDYGGGDGVEWVVEVGVVKVEE
ncbi:LOW QUALITY PROTEIN: hypothetical protein QC763_121727 [Podospora pseudopauciseta]|uniref:Flavin reductase like domain-containing protein n=1 Tax=Podospora pseudopauciseta TaxID=2093780 RepID=A0ABR0I2F8_9PEZI|nr:LOW QUALITY PROTEIN: hypothetical protein QC763_121727 [Podospora pseudopauciseta]